MDAPIHVQPTGQPTARGLPSVRRARVLDILDAHRDVPVVVVEAPAGFGKTTALRQWVEHDPRPLVWITVRPAAPDATWLAHQVVGGLVEQGLLDEPVTLPVAADVVAWHLGLLPTVEHAMASAAREFLLVIDEAGALSGPVWDSLAASIASSLPPGSQLVLATRGQAPSPLRRLRSSGQIVSVGPDQLAFDAVEGAELVGLLGLHLDDDVVLSLLERTGGWPIALTLAGSAYQQGRRSLPALVTIEALADYLRHEVLEQLDADDARFLLRSSVLLELAEGSCDAVSGSTGSLGRLRRLAARTRLIAAVDVHADRFRLHPLLGAFLDAELRAEDPAAWRDAHAAAAGCAERDGDLDAAVYHLRAAGDDDRLGTLVWSHAPRLLPSGQRQVVRRWLEGLPDDRLCGQHRLALAAAWVATQEGDVARAERMRDAARARAAEHEPGFLLDVDVLDATVGDRGLEDLRECTARYADAGARNDAYLAAASMLHGRAAALLGHPDEARAWLDRGYRLSVGNDMPVMVAQCLAARAELALRSGDQDQAVESMREARDIMARCRLDHLVTTAPIFAASAYVYLLEGRLPEARAEAARALRLTVLLRSLAPWFAVHGRLTLANVFLGLGDSARAHELIGEVEAARGPAARSPLIDQVLRQTRDRAGHGQPADAAGATLTTAELRVLQYLPTHLSFPAIAAELFLSRHTVKTQALSAYRKLGAHSRGEAITRAREQGLLPPR